MILIIDTERAEEQGFMLMKHQCTADGCMRVPAKWEELPDGWISVKDRLPEDDKFFLVKGYYSSDGENEWYIGIAEWDPPCDEQGWDGEWIHDTNCVPADIITHWIPIPEPTKENKA